MKTIKYLLLFLLIASFTFAQSGGSSGIFNPRATALGNSSVASARGVYSLGINPANLAYPGEHAVEVSTIFPLLNFNFTVGNDFLSLDEFKYFFSGVEENGEIKGKLLTDADKQRFIDLFNSGSGIRTGFSLPLFNITINAGKEIGSFGFGIEDRFGTEVDFPVDLFKLALYGNPPGVVYSFNDMNLKVSYLRNYSFSYARDITELLPKGILENLNVGITLKMVKGYAYATLERMNTTLETKSDYSILMNNDAQANIAVSPDFGIVWDFEEIYPRSILWQYAVKGIKKFSDLDWKK
jgi:hypothetical protein